VTRGKGTASVVSRGLGVGHQARVANYEKTTGHKHAPLFDSSRNVITLSEVYDASGKFVGTKVTCETRLVVSGFLALFPGKVRKGIADSTEFIFAALRS
jgi:hypothetical protein